MNAVIEAPTISTIPAGGVKVDPFKGKRDSTVSSQWFNRPDDQRFLSISDLLSAVAGRREASREIVIDPRKIQIDQRGENGLIAAFSGLETAPTHFSFGQLCSLGKAPAGYLRSLPAMIAGINLQWGLTGARDAGDVKLYADTRDNSLRAATGVSYGRVFDEDVVRAVQKIAGDGIGDSRWKVPGLLDWSTHRYNPFVDVTKQTTTLYASDRDVFLFLVDDRNPIEIGKLANGEPDYVFRGFYIWNSEVGSRTLGISTFLYRAVCANRNIWGVEDQSTITIRHSSGAPDRFIKEMEPALIEYANSSERGVLNGIKAAQAKIVAENEDQRLDFLTRFGFSAKAAKKAVEIHENEEGRKPASVWDFVQAITASARSIANADDRIDVERKAGDLLAKAAKGA